MSTPAEHAVTALREAGAILTPGLTTEELAALQEQWGIQFSVDHSEFLRLAVPLGEGWVDWRGPAEPIAHLLRVPTDGLLYDVEHHQFWPASWGERSSDPVAALAVASGQLACWPRLVPLYGYRFLPPGPLASPSPVFSVVQSDVTYFGFDLVEWVEREFFGVPLPTGRDLRPSVPHWTQLAEGSEDFDL
jgi:hypothetical protein